MFSLLDAGIPLHILREIARKMNIKTAVRMQMTGQYGKQVAGYFTKEALMEYVEAVEQRKQIKGELQELLLCSSVDSITCLQDLLSDKRQLEGRLEEELASCLGHCFIDVEFTWRMVLEREQNQKYIELLEKVLHYWNVLHNDYFHLKQKM